MPDVSVVVVTYNALPWLEAVPRERARRGDDRRRQRLHRRHRRLSSASASPTCRSWSRGTSASRPAGTSAWRRRQRPLLPDPERRCLADGGRARARSSPSPTSIPRRRSSARACSTRTARCSARCAAFRPCGGSRPSTSSCASSRRARELLNGFYAGGFEHDEVREAEFLMGACMLVRREAVEQVGPLDESLLPLQRGDGLVLPLRGRPAGRCSSIPGAECVHVGGASHGGRMFRENVRGHLRFLAKHRGLRDAERARRLLLAGAAAARRSSSAASAGGCTATRPRWLGVGRRSCRSSSVEPVTLLRLALATGGRARARAPSSPARSAPRGASATLAWALAAVFAALGGDVPRRRLADARRSCCSSRSAPWRCRSSAARRAPSASRAAGGCSARARCSGSCSGTSRARSAATGSSTSRACASCEAFDSLSLDARERVRRRRAPPGLRVPALARLPRARRAGRLRRSRPTSSCTRPRCWRRSRSSSPTRPGYALFRRVGPAVAVVLRRRSR